MHIKKYFFIFILVGSSVIFGNKDDDNYIIVDGRFKNQIVTVKKESPITKKNIKKEEIYNIVLARIAKLSLNDKLNCMAIMKPEANKKSRGKLFESLPDAITKEPICYCLIAQKQKCIIDKQFLEKK